MCLLSGDTAGKEASPPVSSFTGKEVKLPISRRAYSQLLAKLRRQSTFKKKGAKTKRVRDAAERKVVPFKIAEIKDEVPDISRDLIRLVLRTMKEEGLIRAEGRGPGARWVPVEKK